MTKKILITATMFAALSLMATTVLAGPGERGDRRQGWKKARPAQVRIVPRAENCRFAKIAKKDGYGSAAGFGYRFRIDHGRGSGAYPNNGGRF